MEQPIDFASTFGRALDKLGSSSLVQIQFLRVKDLKNLKAEFHRDRTKVQFHFWKVGKEWPTNFLAVADSVLGKFPGYAREFTPEVNSWYIELSGNLFTLSDAIIAAWVRKMDDML